jgi:hypothetical protein
MSDDWKQIIEEMERVLKEVEQDDKDLASALNSAKHPELRQALLVALAVLSDGRKRKGASKATALDEDYLRDHLLPLLKEVLRAEAE